MEPIIEKVSGKIKRKTKYIPYIYSITSKGDFPSIDTGIDSSLVLAEERGQKTEFRKVYK